VRVLSFHATVCDWLVVNNADAKAQCKGGGKANGALAPNGMPYNFMLWIMDGSSSSSWMV
jgi:hypothetical protein